MKTQLGGVVAAAGATAVSSATAAPSDDSTLEQARRAVNFIHDGSHLSPAEYTHLLHELAVADAIQPDSYSNGGAVEEVERAFARWLGKERAVFMPTGTLANHIALRELAGHDTKVLVQAESHIYKDCGDCVQSLSGLNLVPLAPGQVGFTLEDVEGAVRQVQTGRVATRVGAISIESPVRRQADAMFGFDEMQRIATFAREHGIRLHLDGARLFVMTAHTGKAPAAYAELFDTVYVSLYKCFNAVSGAILAGTAAFTENLYHVRRMFGGGLPGAWPFAAVALRYVDSFIEDYKAAWREAEILFQQLDHHPGFQVARVPNGTHIVRLHVAGTDLERFQDRLCQQNIHLPTAHTGQGAFTLKVNPSLSRSSGQAVAQAFVAAV